MIEQVEGVVVYERRQEFLSPKCAHSLYCSCMYENAYDAFMSWLLKTFLYNVHFAWPPEDWWSWQHRVVEFLTAELDSYLSLHPFEKFVFVDNFRLVNQVTETTRRGASLDHIWIGENLCDAYSSAKVTPLKNSDHNCVMLSPRINQSSIENKHVALVRDFRASKICKFIKQLASMDFPSLKNEGDDGRNNSAQERRNTSDF